MAIENEEDFDLLVQNRVAEEAKAKAAARKAALEKKWELRMKSAKEEGQRRAEASGDQTKTQSDPDADPDLALEPTVDEQGRTIDTDSGLFEDIGMGILGGLRDAGANILDTGIDIATLGNNDINIAESDFLAVDVREGAVHGAVRGITQFAAGFIPALGIVGKLGKLGKIAEGLNKVGAGKPGFWRASLKGMTAGLLADASVFDPQEARMSDMLEDGKTFGIDMSNPLTAYLASDEEDSDWEGRFKNAVEGLVMGGVIDTLWYGARSLKSLKKANNTAVLGSATSVVAEETSLRVSRVVAATQETSLADVALKEFDEVATVKGDPAIDLARQNPDEGQLQKAFNDLEDKIESRTAAGADPAEIDELARAQDEILEAMRHQDGAQQRGMDFEDAVRDQDAAVKGEHPREQHRADSPDEAAQLDKILALSRQRIVERKLKGVRAILESREEFAAWTRTAEWKNMTHAERQGFLDTLEFVPKNLEDDIRAIKQELEAAALTKKEIFDDSVLHGVTEPGRSPTIRSAEDFEATPRGAAEAEAAEVVRKGGKDKVRTRHPEAILGLKRLTDAKAAGEELAEEELTDLIAHSNINSRTFGGDADMTAQSQAVQGMVVREMGLKGTRPLKQVIADTTRDINKLNQEAAVTDGKWGEDVVIDKEIKSYADNVKSAEAMEVQTGVMRKVLKGSLKTLDLLGDMMKEQGGLTDSQKLLTIGMYDRVKQIQAVLYRGTRTSARNLVNHRINLDSLPDIMDNASHNLKAQGTAVDTMRDAIAAGEEAMGASIEDLLTEMIPLLKQGRAAGYIDSLATKPISGFRMFLEGWMSMLLSAPPTQMVNIISTQFVGAYRLGELYMHGAYQNVLRGDPTLMLSAQRQASVWMDSQVRLVTLFAEQGDDIMKVLIARYTGDVNYNKMLGDLQRQYGKGLHPVFNTIFTGQSTIAPGGLAMDLAQDTGQAATRENLATLVNEGRGSEVEWLKEGTFGGKSVDAVANLWNIPLTLLNAMDEAAKYVNYNSSLHGEVFEHLYRNTTLRGDALEAEIQRMLYSIPNRQAENLDDGVRSLYEQFHQNAVDTARVYTFTDDLAAGGMTKDFHQYTLKHPSTRLVAPFIRTPANLMNYGFERTPGLHMLTSKYKKLKQAIKEGKANGNLDPKLIQEMEGMNVRMAMGGAVLTGAIGLAQKGKITGAGPNSPEERSALLATGWQPFSFVVDDGDVTNYYSYNRADPLGFFFGIIGSYTEIAGSMEDKDLMELAGGLFTATAESFRSKTYVSGISSAIVALSDPRSKFGPWAAQMAGTLIPAGVAHATKTGIPLLGDAGIGLLAAPDNTMREVDGIMDKIKSRLPGFSADLPPRRNIFGEVISHAPGVGPDTMSPFASRRSPNNLVNSEIQRLVQQHGLKVSMKGYDRMGGVDLTPQQKDEFIQLTGGDPNRNGRDLRSDLDKLMNSSKYKNADDSIEGKQALIHELITKRRARAWKAFLRKNPDLKMQIRAARRERTSAKRRLAANGKTSRVDSLLASLNAPPDDFA
jgi:hypothetical protein